MNNITYSLEEMVAMRNQFPHLGSYEAWKAAGCPYPAQNWPDDPPQPATPQQHQPISHPANIVALPAETLLALPLRGRAGSSRGSRNVLNRQSRKANGRYRDGH
jgi:hypothetical protein